MSILVRLTRPNKFNAERREWRGIMYDSGAERNQAIKLDLMLDNGEIKSWRRQVTVPLEVNGKRVASLRIDFLVEHNNGSKEWIEVKGAETRDWRIKAALFRALFPDETYTVIREGQERNARSKRNRNY